MSSIPLTLLLRTFFYPVNNITTDSIFRGRSIRKIVLIPLQLRSSARPSSLIVSFKRYVYLLDDNDLQQAR